MEEKKEVQENTENAPADVDSENNGQEPESQEDNSTDFQKAFEDQKKRAEKAEAQLKKYREKLKDNNEKKPEPLTTDRDESFVAATFAGKGLDIDEIDARLDKAKKIAQVEDIPLREAIKSDLFQSWEQSYEKKRKSEQAQLKASKGAGDSGKKKDFSTPDLADSDFKEMLRKKIIGQ